MHQLADKEKNFKAKQCHIFLIFLYLPIHNNIPDMGKVEILPHRDFGGLEFPQNGVIGDLMNFQSRSTTEFFLMGTLYLVLITSLRIYKTKTHVRNSNRRRFPLKQQYLLLSFHRLYAFVEIYQVADHTILRKFQPPKNLCVEGFQRFPCLGYCYE